LDPLQNVPPQSVAIHKIIHGPHGEKRIVCHPGGPNHYQEDNENEQVYYLFERYSHTNLSSLMR
jgi:hypothetical protein